MSTLPPTLGEIPNDDVLIASIQERDSNAELFFSLLVSRYYPRTYWLVRKRVNIRGESEDYEEITRDVFTKIWFNSLRYDPDRASVKTWIKLKAEYACLDFVRKRERKLKGFQRESMDQIEERYEILSRDEKTHPKHYDSQMFADEIMEIAKNNFSKKDVEILTLRVFHDMKYREIAEIVNMPESTVNTRFHRLKRRIFELVREDDN